MIRRPPGNTSGQGLAVSAAAIEQLARFDEHDHEAYQEAFDRLIRDLKQEAEKGLD